MPNTGIMASSVHLASAGCTDVLSEPFNNLSAWTVDDEFSRLSIVSGRTGTAVRFQDSIPSITYNIPSAQRSDTFTIGFAYKQDTMTQSTPLMRTWSDSGATEHNWLRINADGSVTYLRSFSSVLATSATGIITAGVWNYIEVQNKLHDTAGFIKVRINGNLVINYTGDTKNGGTNPLYEWIRFKGESLNIAQIDDLYLTTGPSCPFKGDQHIVVDCTTVLREPFDNFTTNGWIVNSSPLIAPGRTGSCAEINSILDRFEYRLPTADQKSTLTVGFAWRTPNSMTASGGHNIVRFMSDDGATSHTTLGTGNGIQRLVVTRAGTTIGSAGSTVLSPNTWYYLEFRATLGDSGSFVVRINGVQEISGTGDTKNGGTKTVYDTVQFYTPNATSGGTNRIDDLYISSGQGCGFKGDQEIVNDCNLVFEDPFDNDTNFPGASITAGGRTGTCLNNSGSTNSGSVSFTPSSYITVGLAYKVSNVGAAFRPVFTFRDAAANDLAILRVETTGALMIAGNTGSPVYGTSVAGLITSNVWYYIEVKAYFADSGGYIEVRCNGSTVIDVSDIDTRPSIFSPCSQIYLRGPGSGQTAQFDDLYLKSGAGCPLNGDIATCKPVLQEPFNNFTDAPWVMGRANGVSEDPTIVSGRNGSGCQMVGLTSNTGSYIYYRVPSTYQNSVLTLGFAWKVNDVTSDIISFWEGRGETENILHTGLFTNAAGGFEFRRHSNSGDTIIASSSNGIYTSGTWYYIEFQMKLGASGFVKLNVNGTTQISASSIDTRNPDSPGTTDKFVAFGIGCTGSRAQTIDDLYLSSGSSCAFKNDPGEIGVLLRDPCDNFTKWSVNGSPTVVTGGNPGNCFQFTAGSSNRVLFTVPAAWRTDTLTIGCHLKVSNFVAAWQWLIWYADNGVTNHEWVYPMTDGSLLVNIGANKSSQGTPAGLITLSTWHEVQVSIKLHSTQGAVKVSVNGTTYINVTGLDSVSSSTLGSAVFDTMRVGSVGSIGAWQVDNIYLRNDNKFMTWSGSTWT